MEYDVFLPGQVPYNITLVLLPSTTITGDPTKEPLYFERQGLSSVCLRTENKTIEYDYKNMRSAYYNTMRSLKEKNVEVSLEEYDKGGHFFIHFDLSDATPEGVLRPVHRTNMRIALKWDTATTGALTLLMLAEGVGHLEIAGDKSTTWTTT
jgi:hypothetical protein